MKDYCDFYLKHDVVLLANVFEIFINSILKNNGLCPSHRLRAPSLSWDAMLKLTKIEHELISDPDIFIFLEKVRKAEFLIFLIDIAKPAINI